MTKICINLECIKKSKKVLSVKKIVSTEKPYFGMMLSAYMWTNYDGYGLGSLSCIRVSLFNWECSFFYIFMYIDILHGIICMIFYFFFIIRGEKKKLKKKKCQTAESFSRKCKRLRRVLFIVHKRILLSFLNKHTQSFSSFLLIFFSLLLGRWILQPGYSQLERLAHI